MQLFSEATLIERKRRAGLALDSVLKSGDQVLVFAGEPIRRPGGLDQTYEFLPHPDYFWLTGSRRALGVSAYVKGEGWVDFVNPLTHGEKLWEGGGEVPPGEDLAEFASWRAERAGGRVFVLGQPARADPELATSVDRETKIQVQEQLNSARRIKDSEEIALIKRLAGHAARGYAKLASIIRPGITERQIQVEYEAEVFRAGAEKMPYDSIVGAGTNAAVLHAIPTHRVVEKGDLILVDAGADIQDYCVDITRVFSADQKFTDQQRAIYSLVLEAQKKAIDQCRPGIEWLDVHQTAARVMASGLKELNLLKGELDSVLETGAISIFFPHGVGHLVGLRVRDVGGIAGKPSRMCCGVTPRIDFSLQENFLVTVEPGLYFVPAILDLAENRERYRDQVNWSEVEKWRQFGGVRIEDDILVTNGEPRNLTAQIPKDLSAS